MTFDKKIFGYYYHAIAAGERRLFDDGITHQHNKSFTRTTQRLQDERLSSLKVLLILATLSYHLSQFLTLLVDDDDHSS